MHALLVTFRPHASEEEFMRELGPQMKASITTPGLIMKTFVSPDPEVWGGFYVFADPASADAYLEGEFFQALSGHPKVSDVNIQHFEVEREPSEAFGTPMSPLAERL